MKRWPAQLGAITLGVAIVWPLWMLEAGEISAKPLPSHALIDETSRAPAQRPYVLLQAQSGLKKLYAATADGRPAPIRTLAAHPTNPSKWDMVEDGVTWFSSQSVATRDQTITVQ